MKGTVNIIYLFPIALLICLLMYSNEPSRKFLPPSYTPQLQPDCFVDNNTDPRVEVTNVIEDQKRPDKIGGPNCVNIEVDLPHEFDENNCVPKKLHFIWVGGLLPDKYISNIKSFKTNNPEYEINLWTQVITQELLKNSTNTFIVNNITSAMENYITKDLIDAEPNMGAKSDILRYEVVYRNGGVYFDTDSHSEKPFLKVLTRSFVTQVNGGYNNISNSVFGFPRRSRFLKYVLKLLRYHIGKNPDAGVPWKTGPAFWSGAFLKYNSSSINMIPQKYLCLEKTDLALVSQTHDASWMG